MPRLLIRTFVREPQCGHFGRTTFTTTVPKDGHSHDFVELFWIESGSGSQTVGGRLSPLAAGMLQLVLPDDEHAFAADPGKRMAIANLAFDRRRWQDVVARYGGDDARLADPDPRRRCRQLDGDALRLIRAAARPVDAGRRDARAIDQLLLCAIDQLLAPDAEAPPAWLAAGLVTLRDRRAFAGASALAAVCGRSREHVARACMQAYGRTPTALINEQRMALAATRLAESDEPIPLIAGECGLENLGHFYRLFAEHHGMTPAAYRKRQRELFGGR